ncbi:4'-phosphopantetheinyl transferase family protein [Luedemannella helvata]|uniref:4'-phosphopantetheinyl transferase superfamily protein n=1 Tax=Luedemannella helvata TaxID=349315 RepID=A0ABN2KY71_9ACTN
MLGEDTVEVWWARLGDVPDARAELLTPEERERFDRYVRVEDARRFAAGSAVVRLATSGYVGKSARDIALDRSCPDCGRPHGRVRLPAEYGLEVSVTHSGDWVGVAFARSAVGLDVERVRPDVDVAGLGRLALAPAERAIVAALPDGDRAAAFTRYWARKEAVLKATGEGLRTAPARVTVTAPGEPPRLLGHAERPELAAALALVDVDPDAEHPAALAVIGAAPGVVRSRDGGALLARTA